MNGVDINSIVLLIVAVMNALTLYYTRRTEKNTNSMKDALVASTGQLAHIAGKEEGRKEGEAVAATMAKGVLEGRQEKYVERGIVATKPLPVADDRTATATERTAAASERVAGAAERAADK